MRYVLAVLLMLGISVPVVAQAPVFKLAFDQPLASGQTYADVQGYVYTLAVDSAAPATLTVTCTDGAPIKCTAPLPAMPSGPHTLTLTATNGFGSASAAPLMGAPPAMPVTVKVVVVVTVGQ